MKVEERFWSQVDKTATCWLWISGLQKDGYGRFQVDLIRKHAHVVSYEWINGAVPEGTEIDHLCRSRNCIRPDHLEAVTHKVNCLRGTSRNAESARKTHCNHGHEFTATNTYIYKDQRYCRTCRIRINRNRGNNKCMKPVLHQV